MSEDKFLEYPHEMIERCADNCDTMRDKIAKLESANKVLRIAMDKIAKPALGGKQQQQWAQQAIKAADEIERG